MSVVFVVHCVRAGKQKQNESVCVYVFNMATVVVCRDAVVNLSIWIIECIHFKGMYSKIQIGKFKSKDLDKNMKTEKIYLAELISTSAWRSKHNNFLSADKKATEPKFKFPPTLISHWRHSHRFHLKCHFAATILFSFLSVWKRHNKIHSQCLNYTIVSHWNRLKEIVLFNFVPISQ